MRLLTDYAGIRPFRLTEIMRQENPAYRAAAKLLSEGKTVEGLRRPGRHGLDEGTAATRNVTRRSRTDYLQALNEKKSVLVVSPTHNEAGVITHAIRSQPPRGGQARHR